MAAPRPKSRQLLELQDLPGYTPNRLVNAVRDHFGFEYDTQLAEKMDIGPNRISDLRRLAKNLTNDMVIRIADVTDWPMSKIKHLAGIDSRHLHQPRFGKPLK